MAAVALRIAPISTLLPHPSPQTNKKPNISVSMQSGCFSHSWPSRQVNPTVCFSLKSDQKGEEIGTGDSFPSPRYIYIHLMDRQETLLQPGTFNDDVDYLWKLAAGSVGGGAAVKYGSILFPDLTKPNILQALLMISLPVFAAVLILVKESRTEE